MEHLSKRAETRRLSDADAVLEGFAVEVLLPASIELLLLLAQRLDDHLLPEAAREKDGEE